MSEREIQHFVDMKHVNLATSQKVKPAAQEVAVSDQTLYPRITSQTPNQLSHLSPEAICPQFKEEVF